MKRLRQKRKTDYEYIAPIRLDRIGVMLYFGIFVYVFSRKSTA